MQLCSYHSERSQDFDNENLVSPQWMYKCRPWWEVTYRSDKLKYILLSGIVPNRLQSLRICRSSLLTSRRIVSRKEKTELVNTVMQCVTDERLSLSFARVKHDNEKGKKYVNEINHSKSIFATLGVVMHKNVKKKDSKTSQQGHKHQIGMGMIRKDQYWLDHGAQTRSNGW